MAKIRENTKEIPVAWRNGTLHYFNVYSGSEIVGNGYLVTRANGEPGLPQLFDITGEKLAEGWYTLQMTEYKLCIIPKNIQ